MNKRTEKYQYNIANKKVQENKIRERKNNMFQRLHFKIEVTIIYRVYLPAAAATSIYYMKKKLTKNNWTLFRQKI